MSEGGVLLCRLERHHDHLSDLAHSAFDACNPKTADPAANLEADRARDALTMLVERFEATLLCLDCNLAEGKAKQALSPDGLPPYFTFKPSEIAAFVIPFPNRVHEINLECARQAWLSAREDAAGRVSFIYSLSARVAAGLHRREIARGRQPEPLLDRDLVFGLFCRAAPTTHRYGLAAAIEARSVSRDSSGNSFRVRRRRDNAAPADSDFALVEAEQRPGRTWVRAGIDWTCACCARTKRDICRRSNRGRWTAHIHVVHEYEAEREATSLARRSDSATSHVIYGSHRAALICQDCRNVTTRLRQRAPELDDACLSVMNIEQLVCPATANTDHEVDLQRAMQVALGNADRRRAVADYRAHMARSIGALAYVTLRIGWGCSRQEALSDLAHQVGVADNTDPHQGLAYCQWLLEEGRRLKEIEAATST